ncbi:hypothetical protein DSUL_100231 [Desulfovibrionales bacterium]
MLINSEKSFHTMAFFQKKILKDSAGRVSMLIHGTKKKLKRSTLRFNMRYHPGPPRRSSLGTYTHPHVVAFYTLLASDNFLFY